MIAKILSLYAAPTPPVLHVCGGEPKPCNYIRAYVGAVANGTRAFYSTTGDTGAPKSGCIGHRNVTEQARLARFLAPVIAHTAGWGAAHRAA
eukprot:3191761-Prymnesium_polylepis.1